MEASSGIADTPVGALTHWIQNRTVGIVRIIGCFDGDVVCQLVAEKYF